MSDKSKPDDTLPFNIAEATRQVQICNACRYCEGYCAVFPSLFQQQDFSSANIVQLANLCHNCRGCYYACQYTEPHAFALNLPRILAEVRQDSWQTLAWPAPFARLFQRSGFVIALLLILVLICTFLAITPWRTAGSHDFYSYMSHNLMVLIFIPAFLLPLLAVGISLRHYWKTINGKQVRLSDVWSALCAAATMTNLAGGSGDGCNFEDDDRFSNQRRYLHQLTLYGFLLCFAATISAAVLHYGFGIKAPYAFLSVPKLLGVPGGTMLCIGTAGLAWLKTKASKALGARAVWGGEMAFILLLFGISATGLLLWLATGTTLVVWLLPLHLSCVLTFFVLTPYSKMVHGFYRLAALTHNAAQKRISSV